MGIVEDIVV